MRRRLSALIAVGAVVAAGCGSNSHGSSTVASAPKILGARCFRQRDVHVATALRDIGWLTAARLLGRADHPGFVALISKRRKMVTLVDYWEKVQGEPGPRWTLWAATPFGYPGRQEVPVEKLFQLPKGSWSVAYTTRPDAAKLVFGCLDRLHRRLAANDRR